MCSGAGAGAGASLRMWGSSDAWRGSCDVGLRKELWMSASEMPSQQHGPSDPRSGRQSTSLVHRCLTWESRFSPLPMIVLSCSAAILACSAVHAATSRRRPVFAFCLMSKATHDYVHCPYLPSHWVGYEQVPVRLGRRVRINSSRPVLLRLVVQSPVTSQRRIVTLLEQPRSP